MNDQEYVTAVRIRWRIFALETHARRQRWVNAVVLIALGWLCWCSLARGDGPDTELRAAAAHVQTLPIEHRGNARYLSLYAVAEPDRYQATQVVSFVLNSVSRSAAIHLPHRVTDTLIYLDCSMYAPSPADRKSWLATWERLASEDRYWHLVTQVRQAKTATVQTVLTDGGWVNLSEAATLRTATGSAGALLRADFFVARAATTTSGGRYGGYYDFTGIPETRAQWFANLGIDEKQVQAQLAARGANLLRSGVTHKTRRLDRWPTLQGSLWNTYDMANPQANNDPTRQPLGFKFDAGEHIATRRNGLHEFTLFDAAGKRQDFVPPEIAIDDSTYPPSLLVPMLSCVRCHAGKESAADGLRGFTDDQSKLLERATLTSDDPLAIEKLVAFYGPQARLARELARDREDYAEAVRRSTGGERVGLTAEKTSAGLAKLYADYAYELVTPAQAAREAGLPVVNLRAAWARTSDPLLMHLIDGRSIPREAWESSFAEAALLSRTAPVELSQKRGVK